MSIEFVVKDDGLWLKFDNDINGKEALISLSSIAEHKTRLIGSAIYDSVVEYLELYQITREYDLTPLTGSFEEDHPVFKMAEEIDNLKAENKKLKHACERI